MKFNINTNFKQRSQEGQYGKANTLHPQLIAAFAEVDLSHVTAGSGSST